MKIVLFITMTWLALVSAADPFTVPVDFEMWSQYSGGASYPISQLLDVNGDGLPDFVEAYTDNIHDEHSVRGVWLNTGTFGGGE